MPANCEILRTLGEFNKWVHVALRALEEAGELPAAEERAREIATQMLDVLNDAEVANGTRLLAIFEMIDTAVENVHEKELAMALSTPPSGVQ